MVSFVQLLCVSAVLVVVDVNARGFREVRQLAPGGPDDCYWVIVGCQRVARQHYGHVFAQLQAGPGTDAAAIIRGELKAQPLTTHCRNFDAIAECVVNALRSSECSNKGYTSTYLGIAQQAKSALNEVCEPQNIELVSQNIDCFTDPDFYNNIVQECQGKIYTYLMKSYPGRNFIAGTPCSDVKKKAGDAAAHCVSQRIEVVSSCADATGNGGRSLAYRMAEKLVTVIMPIEDMGCVRGQRMSLSKKFLSDIGLGFF